ncbi:hypothetical protein GGQ97_001647 [Sphingomonas kaistensis]|uniref:Uncharacterized protein n=1 Tax=Sphingomonas kaistensis TaxID=298708 RepID=A0A7X5Y688_9SPHN|nr:hypothetical protein [Sphingomonas kaistensis]NJC05854.1 hypothetical protein [Sphingomonas kaistensis]
MSPMQRFCLLGFAAGASMPAAALQDDRQRSGSAARWTGPGWYLLEHRGGSLADLIRAGPFPAQAACAAARSGVEPLPPSGHPELDLLTCRDLRTPPSPA